MAQIITYPKGTPKNADYLLGTSTPATNTDDLPVTKNFAISDVSKLVNKGYKSFSALITQELSAQPTMVILNNDLGFTPTVGKDATGLSYLSTQSPNVLYDANKTQILVTPHVTWDPPPVIQTLRTIFAAPKTATTIGFWSFDLNAAAANDYKFFVEIKTFA